MSRSIIAAGVALAAAVGLVVLVALAGCAERPLREDEVREHFEKPAEACQPARDRNGRLIPGVIICDPRRPPVIGSRIVKRPGPAKPPAELEPGEGAP